MDVMTLYKPVRQVELDLMGFRIPRLSLCDCHIGRFSIPCSARRMGRRLLAMKYTKCGF
jgi:hypothetical protein